MGFIKFIKSFDKFGAALSLNYNGEDSYQTIPGGVLSLIFRVLVLYSLYHKLYQLFTFGNPDFVTFDTVVDIENDGRKRFAENDFNVAAVVFDEYNLKAVELPPEYAYFKGLKLTLTLDGSIS